MGPELQGPQCTIAKYLNMLRSPKTWCSKNFDTGSIQYLLRQWSGISIIKSERKRNEKIGGSVKCGKTCPAFIKSIREQQQAIKITIEYQSVHAGREMEVGKLNLHGDDRRNLAALLKAGVPSTKIIEDIQNKCLPTERLGLLTKKDLHDLSHSFLN
ncbi:putative zinc finger transcription factor protein 17 [Trichonephila clavipes]|nr:putative zinc finger transcription factor protein 17 [Trichonephila clavipes]